MSRNKDIKALHSVMGLDYSYLRKRLKANKWDYWATFHEIQGDLAYRFERVSLQLSERLQIALGVFGTQVENFSKSIEELRKAITKGEEKC